MIHDAPVAAPAFERWIDPARLTVPATAARPDLWRATIEVLQSPPAPPSACFIHRDFQHFNCYGRGAGSPASLTGALPLPDRRRSTWGTAGSNLAVLFSAGWAERFRVAYEAETGRSTDPWWDLHELAAYGDPWRQFIPIQVGGRVAVDADGMTGRVEALLESVLGRLGS